MREVGDSGYNTVWLRSCCLVGSNIVFSKIKVIAGLSVGVDEAFNKRVSKKNYTKIMCAYYDLRDYVLVLATTVQRISMVCFTAGSVKYPFVLFNNCSFQVSVYALNICCSLLPIKLIVFPSFHLLGNCFVAYAWVCGCVKCCLFDFCCCLLVKVYLLLVVRLRRFVLILCLLTNIVVWLLFFILCGRSTRRPNSLK